jgi:predicted acylesterase/phospholipase RssA
MPKNAGITGESVLKDWGAAAMPTAFARECDLVLKGGITSGVVYPLAIVEIAKAFRLRGIGGTSAGAIAAAAAAAAELGRQRHAARELKDDPNGFAKLEGLPDHLCAPAASGRGTKLLAFFKPAPTLRPVFETFTALLEAKGALARVRAALGALFSHYGLAAALGALVGGGPLWFVAFRSGNPLVWLWILVGAVVGALVCVAWQVARQVLRGLPANGFGMCSGMPATGDPAPDEALSVWLAQYFDTLSGQREACAGAGSDVDRHKPLTFGDLRRHDIDLQMMSTCLTMGRPFRLPFRDDNVRENNQFFYKESEFAALFPANVTAWMRARERPVAPSAKGRTSVFDQMDFTGFRRLTLPDDLPVVVAVRMSLSFPILLSAIPLYSVDHHKPRTLDETPERCWFTDGGVGSNFPIHFFDSALPARPTFGLDLGNTDDPQAPRVRFPKDNGDARLTYWRRFASGGLGGIAGFLGNVMHVAKDWNHETLSHLPGFRDRIGLILLTRQEGGLNLTMPKERIAKLTEYGREAGRQFVVRFGDPDKWPPNVQPSAMNWGNHQLIRLRLLLASTAELLDGLERASKALHGTPQAYARFFATGQPPHSYRLKGLANLAADPVTGNYPTQAGMAHTMVQELQALARRIDTSAAQQAGVHPAHGAPKPTPELKLRPRV